MISTTSQQLHCISNQPYPNQSPSQQVHAVNSSSAAQLQAAQAQRRKMQYLTLNQVERDLDQVNVYGICVDASYPSKTQNNKFVCTVRIIDPSYHSTGTEAQANQSKLKIINCIFYGRKQEDCPMINQIGDVIRIHRAQAKEHNNQKQLHVNVQFNSSWVLWAAEPSTNYGDARIQLPTGDQDEDEELDNKAYRPYKFSGKNYTFESLFEKPQLYELRQFTQEYLSTNSIIHLSCFTPLANLLPNPNSNSHLQQIQSASNDSPQKSAVVPPQQSPQQRDVDLLVKVMKVFERDEYTYELRIKDFSNQVWLLYVSKMLLRSFERDLFSPLSLEGDVYRIRSVQKERTSLDSNQTNFTSRIITMKTSTNILKFPKYSLIYKQLTEKVVWTDEDAQDTAQTDPNAVLLSPWLISEIKLAADVGNAGNADSEKIYKLQDLFVNYEEVLTNYEKNRNCYRVRLQVYKVEPDPFNQQDPHAMRETAVMQCPQGGNTVSLKNISNQTECNGEQGQLIWQVQFLVKDAASQLNKNFYRVMLYSGTENQPGKEFFGQQCPEPCNLYEQEDKYEHVVKVCRNLTKFNVWLDCNLERRGNYFFIRDTQVNI